MYTTKRSIEGHAEKERANNITQKRVKKKPSLPPCPKRDRERKRERERERAKSRYVQKRSYTTIFAQIHRPFLSHAAKFPIRRRPFHSQSIVGSLTLLKCSVDWMETAGRPGTPSASSAPSVGPLLGYQPTYIQWHSAKLGNKLRTPSEGRNEKRSIPNLEIPVKNTRKIIPPWFSNRSIQKGT